MLLSHQLSDFFAHHQKHQFPHNLSHQLTDAFLQQTSDFGHRQKQLHDPILFLSKLAKLPDCPSSLDLVRLAHSDSPFSWLKLS
jgi:hypothetical protein